MEYKIVTIIVGVLLSCIVGITGYWLKSVYQEFRVLVKEFTNHINKLTQTVIVLQTVIEKVIEEDIKEMKEDIKVLYNKSDK